MVAHQGELVIRSLLPSARRTTHIPLVMLPAVIGGSSTYIVLILCIIGDSSLQRITEPHERFLHSMMETQGVLIVAASLQIIVSYWDIVKFFSPLGMAPVVGLVGLGLFERVNMVKNTTELEQLEKIPKFKARPLNEKVTKPREFHFAIDEWIPPCKNSF
ncbi:hypothetical protein C5167_049852 [Papaver somniferum]|uniref:Uncharacterized protein n=1 Tax=Papaver somniferum TaxID=3469 RepID=A0A4Y7KQG7_PAPSO|nr:hypothetical protein C5167_049852 [Papaver somniferum]